MNYVPTCYRNKKSAAYAHTHIHSNKENVSWWIIIPEEPSWALHLRLTRTRETATWAVGRVSTASDSACCSKFDAAANRFLLVLRFFNVMVSSVVSGPMRAGGSVRRTHGGLFSVRVTSLLRMVRSGFSNAERRTSSVIADLLRRMASMESASRLMRFFAYRYMNIQ